MLTHVLFLLFVALAVYVQGLTGFALSLVLLGLVGVTEVVSLTDAANAVTVLIAVNAGIFLYQRRSLRLDRSLWPAAAASLLGTLAGMAVLTVLAAGAYDVLRALLGVCIVGCALLLWGTPDPLPKVSPPRAFLTAGGLAGVLGGLFSAPGPPLVYLMYRQPWPLARIQESLIFFFGIGALLRLAVFAPTGLFSANAALLAAEAVPVVALVTPLTARYPAPFSPPTVKKLVCLLLVVAGAGMAGSAVLALV
jgi:hypothetical protein